MCNTAKYSAQFYYVRSDIVFVYLDPITSFYMRLQKRIWHTKYWSQQDDVNCLKYTSRQVSIHLVRYKIFTGKLIFYEAVLCTTSCFRNTVSLRHLTNTGYHVLPFISQHWRCPLSRLPRRAAEYRRNVTNESYRMKEAPCIFNISTQWMKQNRHIYKLRRRRKTCPNDNSACSEGQFVYEIPVSLSGNNKN